MNPITSQALSSWQSFWSPATKQQPGPGRPSGGLLSLAVASVNTTTLSSCNAWIISKLCIQKLSIISISVYFHPSADLSTLLSQLQATINDILATHYFDLFIIAGDFNARPGTLGHTDENIIRGSSLNKDRSSLDLIHNQRGSTVLEFFEANGFTLLNGRTPSDTPGHFTFTNKNGQSVVDLTWVNNDSLHLVKDMWVDEIVSKSDHFPTTIEIYSKYSANMDVSNPAQGTSKATQYKLCWKKDKKNNYKHQMAWSPRITCDLAHSHTDILCDNLCSAILDAASECQLIHTVHTNSKRVYHKPWYNNECAAAKAAVKSSLAQCKAALQPWSSYHDIKAKYYSLLKDRRSDFDLQIRKKFRNVRNATEFWSVVNSARKTTLKPSQITLGQWESFFHDIYAHNPAPDYLYSSPSDPQLDKDITIEELNLSLAKSKMGKSPGTDGIPNEFYKALPNNWKLYLVALFNKILSTGTTPTEWSHILMCMLHKKGDLLNPSNYRGIALVNSLEKIFTQIIHERIRAHSATFRTPNLLNISFPTALHCLTSDTST
ncbi:uncharacterized protein LOC123264005 [Cotesia glomerata]|uniref:uncharacterized protein LOC123264005 n=1 Tax=Cotesia glomerata TaxID=32391 RepID=UPI001D001D1B|nr:uncharacterized protein LOC123264005 [Cotesia glomerata]